MLQPLCVPISSAIAALGVCRTKIYHLINRGELERIKIDGATRITVRSIEAYFERRAAISRKKP